MGERTSREGVEVVYQMVPGLAPPVPLAGVMGRETVPDKQGQE